MTYRPQPLATKAMQLCKTITPKCTRYYINGKLVSASAFDEAKHGRRQDCFLTTIRKGTTRHFSTLSPS